MLQMNLRMGKWNYKPNPCFSTVSGRERSAFHFYGFSYAQRNVVTYGLRLVEPSVFLLAVEERKHFSSVGN